jgi:hypothetical protein
MVRNLPFYETGGITATGGEPLAQIDFVTELFKLAKERCIHTAVDTSGITFNHHNQESFDALMEHCDLVMLDIKHTDKDEHIKLTGHSNENTLAFLDYLEMKQKRVWIRHVIVPQITYKNEYLLIYLSKAITIFHLCLHYKLNVFGQPLSNLVFFGLLDDVIDNLFSVNLYITVFVGFGIEQTAAEIEVGNDVEDIVKVIVGELLLEFLG